MALAHPSRRAAGFTMIEMLIVLAIMAVLMGFGLPALNNFIYRGKIEGIARNTFTLMQLARFDAIKRNHNARVVVDYAKDEVYAFSDTDPADGNQFNPAVDREIGRFPLPNRVYFWAANDLAIEGTNALDIFDDGNVCSGTCPPGGWAEFAPPNGSALRAGAIRFGDQRGNFLEVRIVSNASVRIETAKWDGTVYRLQGENGVSWKWK